MSDTIHRRPSVFGSSHQVAHLPQIQICSARSAFPTTPAVVDVPSVAGIGVGGNTAIGGTWAGFSAGTTKNFGRFYTPCTNCIFSIKLCLCVLNNRTGSSAPFTWAAYSARGVIQAITQDFDPAGVTWNNQPTVDAANPLVDIYIEQPNTGNAFTGASTSITSTPMVETRAMLDCSGLTVYGLVGYVELVGPYSAGVVFCELSTFVHINKAPNAKIPVVSRAASGLNRTLVTAVPHGLKTNMRVGVEGVGDEYDSYPLVFWTHAPELGSELHGAVISGVPNSTTITLITNRSVSEATTACTGNLIVY